MSRLDSALRRIVAMLPWYDADEIEQRHARTEDVRQHSIKARQAKDELLEDPMRGSFRRADHRLGRRGAS